MSFPGTDCSPPGFKEFRNMSCPIENEVFLIMPESSLSAYPVRFKERDLDTTERNQVQGTLQRPQMSTTEVANVTSCITQIRVNQFRFRGLLKPSHIRSSRLGSSNNSYLFTGRVVMGSSYPASLHKSYARSMRSSKQGITSLPALSTPRQTTTC